MKGIKSRIAIIASAILTGAFATYSHADNSNSPVEVHTVPIQCFAGADCGITGTATLRIRSDQSFTLQVNADGYDPFDSITLWAYDSTLMIALVEGVNSELVRGGFSSSVLAGGNGRVNLAANNCFHKPWFVPGTAPLCDTFHLSNDVDLVNLTFGTDVSRFFSIFLVDHGEWSPGDMQTRWTFDSTQASAAAFFFLD